MPKPIENKPLTVFSLVGSRGKLNLIAARYGGTPRKTFDLQIASDDESKAKYGAQELLERVRNECSDLDIENLLLEEKIATMIIRHSIAHKTEFSAKMLRRAFAGDEISLGSITFDTNKSVDTKRRSQIIKVCYGLQENFGEPVNQKTLVRSFGVDSLDDEIQSKIIRAIKTEVFKALCRDDFSELDLHKLVDNLIKSHRKYPGRDFSSMRKIDVPVQKIPVGGVTLSGPHFSHVNGIMRVEFRIKNTADKDAHCFFRITRSLGRRVNDDDSYPELPQWMPDRIQRSLERITERLGILVREYDLENTEKPFATKPSEGGKSRTLLNNSDLALFEAITDKVPKMHKGRVK